MGWIIMANILITGANGQLGSEIKELVEHLGKSDSQFFFTSSQALDITDHQAVESYCIHNTIDTIINCAAYTAVDKAETEPEKADLINHLAVKNLAVLAKKHQIRLIHISTDYVFNGQNYRPYQEEDTPEPQSIYGKTKLAGEQAIQKINPPGGIIIRTAWVYSTYGHNFVKTMLRLGKEKDKLNIVFDQIGTPTYAKDLARAILNILPKLEAKGRVEIYHYSNEGVASWYDFAKAIFELTQTPCQVNPIESKDYPTPAKRPQYALLNKSKIKARFDIKIPHWRKSLETALQKMSDTHAP